ncbi:MAG: alkane 1-monooxygenase [Alcanivoracaceae bacterium]|nr:alkane 1-monooxygenase [Alcanivoracaceae bacterium]
MLRYLRFFVNPIVMTIISVGLLFGGVWMWLPGILYIAGVAIADQLYPHDTEEAPYKFPAVLDVALYLSLPMVLLLFVCLMWAMGSGSTDIFGIGAFIQQHTGIDVVAARNNTAWYHYPLMLLSIALPANGASGLAGHELTHRTSRPFDLWLGRTAMATWWGIAFPIEHVYGHHAYVATTKDPATAARGDSLYQHLPKALKRTVVNAWELETERLKKLGKSFWSPSNVLLRMGAVSVFFTVSAYMLAGIPGLLAYFYICFMCKVTLEALNYVEHYGLLRQPDQPVQPRHSWNCNHTVSGVFTYNLTRHSHHHADAQVHYQDLKAFAEQPEMPGGLQTAYLSVFVPSLWRKKIAPKLLTWDREQAAEAEYPLLAQANIDSGWPELMDSVANEKTGMHGHSGGQTAAA